MKIALEKEMKTLLIPLYGRTEMSRRGLFRDRDAERAVMRLDYSFSRQRIREKTQVMLSLRAALIDGFAEDFLKEHPESTVVSLASGPDARAKRLGFPANLWYGFDSPAVAEIRRQLYVVCPPRRGAPASAPVSSS